MTGAWGAETGDYAKSTVGNIAFGSLSGGVDAELTGGNFWQGAITGGIVAGLNHTMHEEFDPKPKPKVDYKKYFRDKLNQIRPNRAEMTNYHRNNSPEIFSVPINTSQKHKVV